MPTVLTLNGGSSSIRFAVYDSTNASTKLLDGKLDRIGVEGTHLVMGDDDTAVAAADRGSATGVLMQRLAAHPLFDELGAVGHRVVHGMQHSAPEVITPALLRELKEITAFDPEHLPREIELIETMTRLRPKLPQVACFDTAFHRTMPRVATLLPIPRRYALKGVQRYGFHGLSYTFLMTELRRLEPRAAGGRVILAHLGNGASLAAVRDGHCIDTSMGFTPSSGLVMSTRSGDLDPGVMSFLASTQSMTAAAFQKMVNHKSGMLGVSETSSDIRDLLGREKDDERAAEALTLFCYQVKKWIGSFAAALGGVDALVFAGGIGENSAPVRSRICEGLSFLGIEVNESLNALGAPLISDQAARVAVRIVRTDEESVIARSTIDLLGLNTERNDA